ncbi:MAG: Crp/Fnr family transcriptional regulator [Bacteroidetes bacterium]|nr:Crp/Fnr family transcriptional regulator [Bacteroidota bacterium]
MNKIIAISDTTVCSLPKNIFLDELTYNSELSIKMLKQFALELKQADELIINLTQKAGVKRIAETLIKIKDFYGQNDKTNALNITFSRNEIASIASVSTESCIRMLAELKKQGVINLVNREIQINDFPKLKIIANSK